MLREILKPVRKQLLKSDRFKRALADYYLRLKMQRHREPYKTLVIITDDGAFVEYMNGRVVSKGYVTEQGGASDSKDFATYGSNNHYIDNLPEGCYSPDGGWHTDVGPCTAEQG